ncbi:restriction endonuclease [Planctomicrobium piriforme]|uniref:Restriction endonuclease n=1 Tax=Planctomicrobium piriforme TaxID=1576369 RepID=A0A1I3DZV3_9PLAN|nr:restriction endonuclease [Planctomicrobium piriforme]SFH92129.1 Restriction endonuclease [Planctomicrobium piriforme]
MDITFHYPPELFNLLVDTIPRLCRSKEDTVLFLRGAGISSQLTADLSEIIRTNRKEIDKFKIVRTVLTRLNEKGEVALRERREIVKRVVEFDDFSHCWDNERLKAQGLVCQIQKLVNVKDSFTRMKSERDQERKDHIAKKERELAEILRKREAIESIKNELYALFGEENPRARGKKLEGILNRWFAEAGIGVRKAFEVVDPDGAGIVEQVDGVIDLNGHLCFVEMKWWKDPVGVAEISQHMMRVFLRAETRAILISASEYTETAVASCRQALTQKAVTLCTLQELVTVLERQANIAVFLSRKMHTTIIDKSPFPSVAIE